MGEISQSIFIIQSQDYNLWYIAGTSRRSALETSKPNYIKFEDDIYRRSQ